MNQAGLGQGKGHPALKDIERPPGDRAGASTRRPCGTTVFPGAARTRTTTRCTNATPSNYWQLPDAEVPAPSTSRRPTRPLDDAGYKARAPTASGSIRSRACRSCSSTAPRRPASVSSVPTSSRRRSHGDRDQAQRQLRRLDHDPVRQLAGRQGRHEVQPGARQLRHVGVRLRPDASTSTATTTTATTRADPDRCQQGQRLQLPPPDQPGHGRCDQRAEAARSSRRTRSRRPTRSRSVYIDQIPEVVLYYRQRASGASAPGSTTSSRTRPRARICGISRTGGSRSGSAPDAGDRDRAAAIGNRSPPLAHSRPPEGRLRPRARSLPGASRTPARCRDIVGDR